MTSSCIRGTKYYDSVGSDVHSQIIPGSKVESMWKIYHVGEELPQMSRYIFSQENYVWLSD